LRIGCGARLITQQHEARSNGKRSNYVQNPNAFDDAAFGMMHLQTDKIIKV
jgi:hypothetical protein